MLCLLDHVFHLQETWLNRTPGTLPGFEAFSPEPHGSSVDARLKVCLAHLQLKAKEKKIMTSHYKAHSLQIEEDNGSLFQCI